MKSLVFIFPLIFLCLSAQELKFTLAIHSGAIDDERAKFSKELEEEFKLGLKNALRESPDVIVIGEMRDLDTMQTAIAAALTGHLVLSTVHTGETSLAIERIINYFPDNLRETAATDVALALQGVIAQRLLPRSDGNGMIPAVEILLGTTLVRDLIA